MTMLIDAQIDFPEALQCLFEPYRYKVLHGGRGGAKSWGVARALISMMVKYPLRVLCAREIQNSIEESVYFLIESQIEAMGLASEFTVEKTSIRSAVGGEFIFKGLKQNIATLKSYEGVDICWVEEATKVSKHSWQVLIPTIRSPKAFTPSGAAEIWVTFNPDLETDETYVRFVLKPPTDSVVQAISWRDNPWFPEVLRQEMLDLKAKDFDSYLNVWEGHCQVVLDGAVYAQEVRDLILDGRIRAVPFDPSKPVDTFWDLGFADNTSIWFGQTVGMEYRIIDYYTNNMKPLSHYLEVLKNKKYTYGNDWLPHDAQAKQMGSGRSIEELMRAQGRQVRIVPRLSLVDGINAARTILPICWFDSKLCSEGLKALKAYKYEVKDGQFAKTPLHDWSSHGADAFRYLAIALKQPHSKADKIIGRLKKTVRVPQFLGGGAPKGWMR